MPSAHKHHPPSVRPSRMTALLPLRSTHHPRLLSQPWEGNVPSGRHPDPTTRPLLGLEVRICGRRDSWVRVPAYCHLPGCWANISGIKRRAACPARPSGVRRCWVLRLHCLCQGLWAGRTQDGGHGGSPGRTPGFSSGPRRPFPSWSSSEILEWSVALLCSCFPDVRHLGTLPLMRIEIHQVSFAHPIGRIRTFWGRTWEFVFINTDV